jgi:hypothetical protein
MKIISANERSIEIFANVLIKAAEWLNFVGKPMWNTRHLTVE